MAIFLWCARRTVAGVGTPPARAGPRPGTGVPGSDSGAAREKQALTTEYWPGGGRKQPPGEGVAEWSGLEHT